MREIIGRMLNLTVLARQKSKKFLLVSFSNILCPFIKNNPNHASGEQTNNQFGLKTYIFWAVWSEKISLPYILLVRSQYDIMVLEIKKCNNNFLLPITFLCVRSMIVALLSSNFSLINIMNTFLLFTHASKPSNLLNRGFSNLCLKFLVLFS